MCIPRPVLAYIWSRLSDQGAFFGYVVLGAFSGSTPGAMLMAFWVDVGTNLVHSGVILGCMFDKSTMILIFLTMRADLCFLQAFFFDRISSFPKSMKIGPLPVCRRNAPLATDRNFTHRVQNGPRRFRYYVRTPSKVRPSRSCY